MSSSRNPWRLVGGLAVAALLAGCSDAAGPVDLSNPAALSASLQSVDSTFDSEAFASFSATSVNFAFAASGSLSAAATLVDATRPALPSFGHSPFRQSTLRVQRLQRSVPSFSVTGTAAAVLPPEVLGKTFEWNITTDQYEATARTGAPANGARFILYRIDPATEQPLEPLVEVGQVDLRDESTSTVAKLRIVVAGVGGTPEYLNYLASVTASATSFTATASGFITNGRPAAANKRLDFAVTITANESRVTVTSEFTLNNPSITLRLVEAATFSNNVLTLSVDFRIIRPGEQVVRLAGRVTLESDALGNLTVTVNAAVYLGDGKVASIQGDSETATWVDAGGLPLSADEIAALDHLKDVFEHFESATEAILGTLENLFGA